MYFILSLLVVGCLYWLWFYYKQQFSRYVIVRWVEESYLGILRIVYQQNLQHDAWNGFVRNASAHVISVTVKIPSVFDGGESCYVTIGFHVKESLQNLNTKENQSMALALLLSYAETHPAIQKITKGNIPITQCELIDVSYTDEEMQPLSNTRGFRVDKDYMRLNKRGLTQ